MVDEPRCRHFRLHFDACIVEITSYNLVTIIYSNYILGEKIFADSSVIVMSNPEKVYNQYPRLIKYLFSHVSHDTTMPPHNDQ